jgi:hypothetical protein
MAGLVQVINRSSSDDLKEKDIKIEVRLKDLYVLNNYTTKYTTATRSGRNGCIRFI